MNRKAFHDLLKRYLKDKCTSEEKALIDQWYELLDDELPKDTSAANMRIVEQRLWSKIRNQITVPISSAEELPEKKPLLRPVLKWVMAAAILFAILVTGILLNKKTLQTSNPLALTKKLPENFSEFINNSDTIKVMVFEDGSKISMRPLARISYPKHFSKTKREVYLEGDAFFSVNKNTARPFFVYTDNLVTQVLGTQFYVEKKNNKIEVSVSSGKVAVYENSEQISLDDQQKKMNGVIITPNQKVSYFTQNRHFITSLVDEPAAVSTVKNDLSVINFVFDDAPLIEVLSNLEAAYDIEIVLEDEQLRNCPFTGDIMKHSLYNKLELICLAFEATYEIKGTRILVKGGKNCLEN